MVDAPGQVVPGERGFLASRVARGCPRSDHYADISLSQWMGVLPPELIKAHLNLPDDVIAGLPRTKRLVVA